MPIIPKYPVYASQKWSHNLMWPLYTPPNQEIHTDVNNTIIQPPDLAQISPSVPWMSLFSMWSRCNPGSCIAFGCQISIGSFRLAHFLYLFPSRMSSRVLKSTCLSSGGWSLTVFSHDDTEAMHSWQGTVEMILCSSQCIRSGDTQCKPTKSLLMLTWLQGQDGDCHVYYFCNHHFPFLSD